MEPLWRAVLIKIDVYSICSDRHEKQMTENKLHNNVPTPNKIILKCKMYVSMCYGSVWYSNFIIPSTQALRYKERPQAAHLHIIVKNNMVSGHNICLKMNTAIKVLYEVNIRIINVTATLDELGTMYCPTTTTSVFFSLGNPELITYTQDVFVLVPGTI